MFLVSLHQSQRGVYMELEKYCLVEENILDKLMPRAFFTDSYIVES